MITNSETRKQWASLKERGDVTAIAKKNKLRRPSVSVALNTGVMPVKYYAAISKFYNARYNKINNAKKRKRL